MVCINRLNIIRGAILLPLFALIAICVSFTATAVEPFKAGSHYRVLTTELQTDIQQAIELEYWFWPGCASCQLFELNLEQLNGSDIAWQKVPAQLRDVWYFHAKAFYVAQQQSTQLTNKLQEQLFRTPKSLTDIDQVTAWFTAQGADSVAVEEALLSPLLNQKLEQNLTRQHQLAIRGVPTLIIGQQYLLDAGMVKSVDEYIAVAQYLLGLIRQQREEAGFEWSDEELLAEPVTNLTTPSH